MREQTHQVRDKRLEIGIIFVCFSSLIIGFLNIATLYSLGLPFIGPILGIVFIWLSKAGIRLKIILPILCIPFARLGFVAFYLLLPRSEPEIFLIPQNYRGDIVVIFNEPCGASVEYESAARVYRFPETGLIISNAKRTEGLINRRFFLVDAVGSRTEIHEFAWSDWENEKDSWRWYFSRTELTKESVGIFWGHTTYGSYIVSDFASKETELNEVREARRNAYFKEVKRTLEECKSKK